MKRFQSPSWENDGVHRQTNISKFFLAANGGISKKNPRIMQLGTSINTRDSVNKRDCTRSNGGEGIQSPAADRISHLKKRKLSTKSTPKQMYLDFGQKSFAQNIVCKTCGMLFVRGVEEDKVVHEKNCANYTHGVSFRQFTKTLRIVDGTKDNKNCKIIEIRSSDSNSLRQRVEAVRSIAHEELGFVEEKNENDGLPRHKFRLTFLLLMHHRAVGLLTVEPITKAYVMDTTTLERLPNPVPGVMGVHTVWVHERFRGQKIASRLLDAARSRFLYGTAPVPQHRIAFSSPTLAGIHFALSYLRQKGDVSEKNKLLIYQSS